MQRALLIYKNKNNNNDDFYFPCFPFFFSLFVDFIFTAVDWTSLEIVALSRFRCSFVWWGKTHRAKYLPCCLCLFYCGCHVVCFSSFWCWFVNTITNSLEFLANFRLKERNQINQQTARNCGGHQRHVAAENHWFLVDVSKLFNISPEGDDDDDGRGKK